MKPKNLKQLLVKHEGLKLHPYHDSEGITTIGVGRNLESVGITEDEAMILLDNDIKIARLEASKYPWFFELSNVRKDVIINMMFNLGAYRFSKFKKFISFLEKRQYSEAAAEMLNSKWATQVGSRSTELALMIDKDQYPS